MRAELLKHLNLMKDVEDKILCNWTVTIDLTANYYKARMIICPSTVK